jgi:hypothetical protein
LKFAGCEFQLRNFSGRCDSAAVRPSRNSQGRPSPHRLHTATVLVEALQDVAKHQAEGRICEGDVGILVN